MLNTVDTASVVGRSGCRCCTFKSREAAASGRSARSSTVVEADSRWAVNPPSFQWGWICFDDNNKILGEKLVPVSQPMPDVTELPDKGFEWQQDNGRST